MISGDQLIMTRQGLHVSNKTLESIGIYPDSQVYMLPFQTFEYRESEPAYHFPMDLLVTPIPPKRWPFVMRFLLRLKNRPGTLDSALSFFSNLGINILYSECTRSGHHHAALNLLGEVTRLEALTVSKIFEHLGSWYRERKPLFKRICRDIYNLKESNLDDVIRPPQWWGVLEEYGNFVAGNERLQPRGPMYEELKKLLDEMSNLSVKEKDALREQENKLNKLMAKFLASYARSGPAEEPAIQNLLEMIIDDAKPLIFENEAKHKLGEFKSRHELYYQNEKVMLLPRLLLSVIVSYKRVLCEKYKILIIRDSLRNVKTENDLGDGHQSDVYLYNIKYYDHVYKYPVFCEPLIFNSPKKGGADLRRDDIYEIFKKVDSLKQDRKSTWSLETRLDLDPVLVTPVESLCHAAYHRAYEEEFECKAGDSIIPFPDPPDYPERFIGGILTQNSPATIAIASKNEYDLTLRLCPLPVSSLPRFLKIDLDRYNRDCMKHCKDNFFKSQSSKICSENSILYIDDSCSPGKTRRKVNNDSSGIECRGSTVGLLSTWTQVIRDHSLNDEISQPTLNIWRAYNRTFKLSETAESGSFHALVLATDDIFKGFPNEIHTQIEEKFKVFVKEAYRSGHVNIGKVTKARISGGRVFVSLPFIHPMSKQWLHCVKKVGNEFGFTEVDTVESYTEPVTELVANRIKSSHAMIQILALPVGKFDDLCKRDSSDYYRRMTWLFAEYLTAITNKLKVARLIDESTIDEKEFLIGRDHASFRFSAVKPFSDFEDNVQKAFTSLRKELADILGLG